MGSSSSKHVEHGRVYMGNSYDLNTIPRMPSYYRPRTNFNPTTTLPNAIESNDQFTTTFYPDWMTREKDSMKIHAQDAIPVYIVYTKSQQNEMLIKFFLSIAVSAIAALISGILIIHYSEWRKNMRVTAITKVKKWADPTTFETTIG